MNQSAPKTENGKSRLKANKWWIVVYLVSVFVLCVAGMIPLGYSEQDNEPVSINFASEESKKTIEEVDTRHFSDNYTLTVTDNVQVDSFEIFFRAPNESFKGILTAKISDEDGVVDRTTVNLASTGHNDSFTVANGAFDIDAQLKKDCSYVLNLKIDTNAAGSFFLQSSDTHRWGGTLSVDRKERNILSNVTYTPLNIVRYWDAFYGFILLIIFLGGYVLLTRLGINLVKTERGKKIGATVQASYNEIILLLTFAFLALYEFYFAYFNGVYISPDSGVYLKEASAILGGYGFNYEGPSGYTYWLASFPIGYPVFIAITAFFTGRNVYLASKILSVLFVGATLLLLYFRFRKQAWVYVFCLFNIGFLYIYKFTWSENPFIFGLILFGIILEHITKQDKAQIVWFVLLGFSSGFLFLCRYFGVFSLMAIGLVFVYYCWAYLLCKKERNQMYKHKLLWICLSGLISSAIVGGYFMLNYLMCGSISGTDRTRWWDDYSSLTTNYVNSLVTEIGNATRSVLPETLSNVSQQFQVLTVILVLLVLIYLLRKNSGKDFKTIFIGLGLFYYLVFTFVRYHSSMDPFGPRFLVPASILISIGLLGFLVPFLNQHKHQIAPVIIGALLILISALSYNLKDFDRQTTAYAQLSTSLQGQVKDVPERSTILYGAEIDDRTRVFRPDLYLSGEISPADTMDALFQRYSNSEYICVKAKYIKQILNYPVYDYDSSVVEFFSEIPLDMPDEQYIVISVKDQKIAI